MENPNQSTPDHQEPKEWTLMFYFASDNPLAPNVVSQLKAIKNAGFHNDVNVITKFDPNTAGTPTHIFDVNLANKLTTPGNGFHSFPGNDPFVRSLVMDKLWGDNEHDQAMRTKIAEHLSGKEYGVKYDPPIPPNEDEPSPKKSLQSFLKFCAEKYPARHYMLLILGHGLVVGNHMFLYDAVADEASLSLLDLAGELNQFKEAIKDFGELELLGFHSCSMSSLELAYELQGTANYMLASQGPNFVGSWPYREICIRVFNDQLPKANGVLPSPGETIHKIFSYILSNSFDFQLAGYSFDLALCDLREAQNIKAALTELSGLLIDALADDPLLMELILVAHWEAQSYWQETYTDLLDFCSCLNNRCKGHLDSASEETRAKLQLIQAACSQVIQKLKTGKKSSDYSLIARSEFAGPEFQYSQGLSVYFPWSQPSDERFWPTEYFKYQFKETGWGQFLGEYFRLTQRKSIGEEIEKARGVPAPPLPLEQELLGEMLPDASLDTAEAKAKAASALGAGDKTGGADALGAGEKTGGASALGAGEKTGGASALGGDCDCPSIKNYPKYTRKRPTSPGFFDSLRQAD
jgi:hypothetical protein